jgi:hypothetical protein
VEIGGWKIRAEHSWVSIFFRQAMARAFRGWLLACFGVLAIATVTGLEPGSAVSFSLDSKEVPDCSLQGWASPCNATLQDSDPLARKELSMKEEQGTPAAGPLVPPTLLSGLPLDTQIPSMASAISFLPGVSLSSQVAQYAVVSVACAHVFAVFAAGV